MDEWILYPSGYSQPGPSASHLSGFDCSDLPLTGKSDPDGSTDGETLIFTGPPKLSATGIMTLKNGRADSMLCVGAVGTWGCSSGGNSAITGSWTSCCWCWLTGTDTQPLSADCCTAPGIITAKPPQPFTTPEQPTNHSQHHGPDSLNILRFILRLS